MYTVASPDSNPKGEGQLPYPNECNSILTSATREDMVTPNPYPYPLYWVSHKKGIDKKVSIYSF